jgi:methionyl-tRNA synthetase
VNIERAAAARGVPVKEHVDQIVDEFKTAFAKFNVRYDRWIRTTDRYHEEAVERLWKILDERGYIYKGNYEGWFCPNCNEFKDVEEKTEQPTCPIHQRPLERIAEESYFFKLSEFQKPLLQLYESRPDFVQPDVRRNEVLSFVQPRLRQVGHPRAGRPGPHDLRVAGRALELHHGARLGQRE